MSRDQSVRAWQGRQRTAFALRAAVHTVPFIAVSGTLYWIQYRIGTPSSTSLAILQWVGFSVVSMSVLIILDRLARRLLPLALLLQMSLIFPDTAPSRFRTSMRQNTTRQLQRDLEDDTLEETTPQEAAESLLALVAELSRHDRLTRGHSERVRAYADMMGEELDLSDEDRSKLQWAALAHDIGKLRVDQAILNKKGRPTVAEWKELKTHPEEGWILVAPLRSWLGDWALAVRDHHERWDGDGYPRGLAGTEISLAGRIVSVIDAFDVMTSTRSYKDPMPVSAARAELARCSGTHFDAEIVRAFLALGIGRLRIVMGPLSWLAQLPLLARLPFAQLPATVGSSAAAVALSTAAFVVVPLDEAPLPQGEAEPAEAALIVASPPTTIAIVERLIPANPEAAPSALPPTGEVDPAAPDPPPEAAPAATTNSPAVVSEVADTDPPPTTSPPAVAATTTTTTTTTTTPPPVALTSMTLGGTGEGPAPALSPLNGSLISGPLANYDTNLNTDPGLTISRSNKSLGTFDDPGDFHTWAYKASAPLLLPAALRLDVWVATRDFDQDRIGVIAATIARCSDPAGECETLGTTSASFNQTSFGGNFGLLTLDIAVGPATVDAGDYLIVVLNVPNESEEKLWIAYGASDYPSRLWTS